MGTGTVTSYTYNKDKMSKYGAENCVYDAVGNPTTYRGKAAVWTRGRKLISYDGNTFNYDAQGRRLKKNNITYYYDSNGRLLKQSNGLEFIYDNAGVIGVKYSNEQYFYRRDAQGNIVAILNASGEVVANCVYDAWGNHKVVDDSGNIITSGVGVINPFRYRGYYFDTETGFYFLQTRYYDPEVGRFISQDNIDYADPETINGINLYAYCGNNPVMNVDPTGKAWWEFWKWDWKKIAAAVVTAVAVVAAVAFTVVTFGTGGAVAICAVGFTIGFTGSLISQSLSGQGINWGKALFDGVWGIVGIAGAASGISALGSVMLGGFIGGLQSISSDMIFNNGNINVKNLIYSVVGGAIGGLFAGAGAKSTIKAVQSAGQILKNTIANGTKHFIGKASEVLAKNAFKLLQSVGLYLYGVIVGQSIVLGGTT